MTFTLTTEELAEVVAAGIQAYEDKKAISKPDDLIPVSEIAHDLNLSTDTIRRKAKRLGILETYDKDNRAKAVKRKHIELLK